MSDDILLLSEERINETSNSTLQSYLTGYVEGIEYYTDLISDKEKSLIELETSIKALEAKIIDLKSKKKSIKSSIGDCQSKIDISKRMILSILKKVDNKAKPKNGATPYLFSTKGKNLIAFIDLNQSAISFSNIAESTFPANVNCLISARKVFVKNKIPDMIEIAGGKLDILPYLGGTTLPLIYKEEGNVVEPKPGMIINDFLISKYPIMFHEYIAFCKATGRDIPCDNEWGTGFRPVINVNKKDIDDYCNWLSELTGKLHRLPTNNEFEYLSYQGCIDGTACFYKKYIEIYRNKGNKGIYVICGTPDNDPVINNYTWASINKKNTKTIESGSITKQYGCGVYDLFGNVDEVVSAIDRDGNQTQLLRGGSWKSQFISDLVLPKQFDGIGCNSVGFRVVIEK